MALHKKSRDVVTLADLSPRREVKGGSCQRVFGADAVDPAGTNDVTLLRTTIPTDTGRRAMKKPGTKDLPPKSPTSIKGGRLLD